MKLLAALAIITLVLLLVVDIGPSPPKPALLPTYAEALENYYAMRGNNLVFADVEGTWQATGRRISGRFEILNAAGDSFLMLDRYDGKVFTAGHSANDNLYLNRITLQTGPSANVKPAEIHLEDQCLVEALPIVHEMQREPGLEHIYISGDIVVPVPPNTASFTLFTDYAQTSLRRIQAHDGGHYSLHYLTAGDLIKLANVQVKTADLVIVATYASPATGPTVTPLPSPPPAPGAAP